MASNTQQPVSHTRRRLGLYILTASGSIILFTALYQWSMAAFEGISVSWIEALHVVIETFTTTGYGEDASQWSSAPVLALSILMQLTGVAFIFTTLPLFVVPLVERALEQSPPTTTTVEDHVVVSAFTDRGAVLINELQSQDVSHVVIEPDRNRAIELTQQGYEVIHGDPEAVDTLASANVSTARALIADGDDRRNASVILAARELTTELRIVSFAEDPQVADYHEYAGADEVVSPRQLLGESLARKAASPIASKFNDAIPIGDDFEIAEVLVHPDSTLVGKKIINSEIGQRTGVNIIGIWFRGEFVSPPSPEAKIDEHSVLVVTGSEEQLERLHVLAQSQTRRHRRGRVVVAGYGEVGRCAAETLESANLTHVIIDQDQSNTGEVDVIGDVTDAETLSEAEIEDAESVLLAIDNDTAAIFATLVISQLSPQTEIIVRANDAESVPKLYHAGAEYVLALSTVSGRILASSLAEQDVIVAQSQIEVVRTDAPGLAGQSLVEADIRARTGSTVVAAERDNELQTNIGPDFVIQKTDTLVVVGTDAGIKRFNQLASP